MTKKLFFLAVFFAGSFLVVVPTLAQTCPHIYEGINCGANWYCNGCQTTCKTCPGGGDPTGATELNYVSCSCSCPSGQIVCASACTTAPACSTPTREQNNSSCNGCGACKSGYAADPSNPNPPSPCLKAAYIDYPNTGYFQVSGDLKSTGGDLYLASGKTIRVDGAGTTTLGIGNFIGTTFDLSLTGGLVVKGGMALTSQGAGTINAEKLCIQGSCRDVWPTAVSAFVDEGNTGFGPTAVLGTNDNIPLSFETNDTGRMYIDMAGNVGIGTTSPNKLLHIYKSSGDNAEIDIQSVAGANKHWAIYNERSNNSLRFWNNDIAVEKNALAILNNGNVGIGTVSPSYQLDVYSWNNSRGISSTATQAGATGVYGESTAGSGYGIYGKAWGAGPLVNFGGYFEALGDSGIGVYGKASGGGPVLNYGGYFTASGSSGRGVVGSALGASAIGVEGAGGSAGVVGTGGGTGGSFTATGVSGARGVSGLASGASGTNYGVYGQVTFSSGWAGYFTGGKGVFTPQLCLGTEGNCRTDWPAVVVPGGSNTQVQFNDGGTFGGNTGLIYDKTAYSLLVAGTLGINGLGTNPAIGVQARGSNAGGYFKDSIDSGYAYVGFSDYGVYGYGSLYGLYGLGGSQGVYGNGTSYGVYGTSNYTGVYGYGNTYGVYGATSFAAADAGYFWNSNTNTYARLGYSTWAGYFGGGRGAYADKLVAGSAIDPGSYNFYLTGQGYITSPGTGLQVVTSSDGSVSFIGQTNGAFGGIGVKGMATNSTSGAGVYGEAQALSGTSKGVQGYSSSATGWGGYFSGGQGLYAEAAVVGGVSYMGAGKLNAVQLCINGDCRPSWPSGGTPGVPLNSVQFNDSGAFGGDVGLVYNSGTDALTVGGLLTAGSLTIDSLSGVLKASGGVVSGWATTDNLTEGATNLYFTNARVRTAISKTGPISYDAGSGVIGLSTPLAIGYGGTGITTTPPAGTVVYGNGATYAFTAAGSAGQFLQSTGAGAPTWATIPSGVSGSGSANYVAKFTGATTVGNSQIIDNGTNIQISGMLGIGWSPIYKLDVNGTSYLGGATTVVGALSVSGDLSADNNTPASCGWESVPSNAVYYTCSVGKFMTGIYKNASSIVTYIQCCEL